MSTAGRIYARKNAVGHSSWNMFPWITNMYHVLEMEIIEVKCSLMIFCLTMGWPWIKYEWKINTLTTWQGLHVGKATQSQMLTENECFSLSWPVDQETWFGSKAACCNQCSLEIAIASQIFNMCCCQNRWKQHLEQRLCGLNSGLYSNTAVYSNGSQKVLCFNMA